MVTWCISLAILAAQGSMGPSVSACLMEVRGAFSESAARWSVIET